MNEYIFKWGKYKGRAISDVLEIDPQYIIWAHANVDWFNPSNEILEKAWSKRRSVSYHPYDTPGEEMWGMFPVDLGAWP